METSAKTLHQTIRRTISKHADEQESETVSRLILESVLGLTWTDIVLDKKLQVNSDQNERLMDCLHRLERQEPVQYILGTTHFYGRQFVVNKSVLIPRPETEEMVEIIIGRNTKKKPVIVDMGTGSGCIAITLKKELPDAEVYAYDISESALEVAVENAFLQQAEIHFQQLDIVSQDLPQFEIDLLVSNPPYISYDDQPSVHAMVKDFEPEVALFADQQDPILIYSKILERCIPRLNEGAWIFFEINPRYSQEVVQILKDSNCQQVEVIPDLQGKERVALATWRFS